MPVSGFAGFPADTLHFLEELQENNNREWFAEHKSRYEQSVLTPALGLITALQKPLVKVAPLLRVEPKRMGGSLMRIYKDTRFSKDKLPYKTNIGIQFRHQYGGDVHAPGVYLHIAPAECFLGVGTWRPPADALRKIRHYIVSHEATWKKLLRHKKFNDTFTMHEDRLKSTPRGYDKQYPLIDQLRQQSFLGMVSLTHQQIQSPELVTLIPKLITAGNPLMAHCVMPWNSPGDNEWVYSYQSILVRK